MEVAEHQNESWYKISNYDTMRPFFMSIVSDSNHWMFLSSNGGLTAGRKNPEYALFPYYTDDKITESADITGSKTIFQVHSDNNVMIWEPFSERFTGKYKLSRNLYKSIYGNKILFEEINHDLKLGFRYQWNNSNLFGFIKQSELVNLSAEEREIALLDGIQNIMPFGVSSDLQRLTSNLVDAYKRSELFPEPGIGIFALSAIIVDKAEPSEALKANIAWSIGLGKPSYLLSSNQLNAFRQQQPVQQEQDVKGEKGAYFVNKEIRLPGNSTQKWKIIANVNQSHTNIIALEKSLREKQNIDEQIGNDIDAGTQNLIRLNASADGLQFTADMRKDTRHFSNVLFNIMRGGIFDNNYQIEKNDFIKYLGGANKKVLAKNQDTIGKLEDMFSLSALKDQISATEDADLIRLSIEYLPLKFSRRHGDPSRPWNNFSINTINENDGSKILDYEGNWRDIFQNWEALAHSYPQFIEGMIFRFLNASTFDGYNPYRITKGGFDWETIEPDNPWSYIGYWGDHQVIYLLKFLEFINDHQPETLEKLLNSNHFAYANVPYRIKPYSAIVTDPKNTIDFDEKLDLTIREKVTTIGADGSLLGSHNSEIYHVSFMEKILTLTLSKMSNFIPEGGIWMNTQRPEWNDANNALVGNGVSMVTLYYLRRFFSFWEKFLSTIGNSQVTVSEELTELFHKMMVILEENQHLLKGNVTNEIRKAITDLLGQAGSKYRETIYTKGFSGKKVNLGIENISRFNRLSLQYLEHTINKNCRSDNLYHSYNILSISNTEMSLSQLDEMLEGQVAAISSGYLNTTEIVSLLDALRKSDLYRKDQNSYILYPNKALKRFLEKNTIPQYLVEKSALLMELIKDNNLQILNRDLDGEFHFNGNFKNVRDLKAALKEMNGSKYQTLAEKEKNLVAGIWEEVFNHKAFTGRSGTFFAYEGLGSIYWHMVSKLHLAVHEACIRAIEKEDAQALIERLIAHHREIGQGIGVHKSPGLYGAFPTDPYSHTPQHKGAQQPGMTGQVKEDILVRWGELGVKVQEGKIHFNPALLSRNELLKNARTLTYINVNQEQRQIKLQPDSLCFTFCQVPVIYQLANKEALKISYSNRDISVLDSLVLDKQTSQQIFNRTGKIEQIIVSLPSSRFK